MTSVQALLETESELLRKADLIKIRLHQDDLEGTLAARSDLSVHFNGYIVQEIRFIRNAANRQFKKHSQEGLTDLVEYCREVRRRWDAYMVEWHADAARDEPTLFENETLAILGQLEDRLMRASAILAPLGVTAFGVRLRKKAGATLAA